MIYPGTLRIGEAMAQVERIWLDDGQIKVRASFPASARNEAGPVTLFDPEGRQVASGQRYDLSDFCRGMSLLPYGSLTVTWVLTVLNVNETKMVRPGAE